ncbi:10951_t:CDS:2, partial [Racocetra persica]
MEARPPISIDEIDDKEYRNIKKDREETPAPKQNIYSKILSVDVGSRFSSVLPENCVVCELYEPIKIDEQRKVKYICFPKDRKDELDDDFTFQDIGQLTTLPQELEFTLSENVSDDNFIASDRYLTVKIEDLKIPDLPTISRLHLFVKRDKAKVSDLKEGDKIKISGIKWNKPGSEGLDSKVKFDFDGNTNTYSILNINQFYDNLEQGLSTSLIKKIEKRLATISKIPADETDEAARDFFAEVAKILIDETYNLKYDDKGDEKEGYDENILKEKVANLRKYIETYREESEIEVYKDREDQLRKLGVEVNKPIITNILQEIDEFINISKQQLRDKLSEIATNHEFNVDDILKNFNINEGIKIDGVKHGKDDAANRILNQKHFKDFFGGENKFTAYKSTGN